MRKVTINVSYENFDGESKNISIETYYDSKMGKSNFLEEQRKMVQSIFDKSEDIYFACEVKDVTCNEI